MVQERGDAYALAGTVVTTALFASLGAVYYYGKQSVRGESRTCTIMEKERVEIHRRTPTAARPYSSPRLPPGKVLFVPTTDWAEVYPHHVCPMGLEYRMNFASGRNFARCTPGSEPQGADSGDKLDVYNDDGGAGLSWSAMKNLVGSVAICSELEPDEQALAPGQQAYRPADTDDALPTDGRRYVSHEPPT